METELNEAENKETEPKQKTAPTYLLETTGSGLVEGAATSHGWHENGALNV
jgi:hypothetical protein